MIRNRTALAAIALVAAAGPAAEARAATVVAAAEVQQHAGLTTTRLTARQHASQIDAFAKVLDPGPLVQLDSDLRTAQAAADASRAEARRSQALANAGGGVAAKDAEAALAQARADALKVELLKNRLGLEWGPGVARLSPARRAHLIRALSAGRTALVHVDTPNNAGQAGARSVKVDVGDGSMTGTVIGPARQAEPRLQSSGLIAEVSGPQAVLLSIGLTQSAHIALAEQQTGVVAPRSAVIRYRGSDWVYVRVSATGFDRRLVQDPIPEEDGFFVAHGLAPGDEVVTHGAVALFTAEQGSKTGGR